MKFRAPAVLLIGGGMAIGLAYPHTFTVGGWFTAVVLLFALLVQLTPLTSRR